MSRFEKHTEFQAFERVLRDIRLANGSRQIEPEPGLTVVELDGNAGREPAFAVNLDMELLAGADPQVYGVRDSVRSRDDEALFARAISEVC